jgi:hypothetical protein
VARLYSSDACRYSSSCGSHTSYPSSLQYCYDRCQLETSIGAVSRLKSFGEKVRSESLDGEDVKPPREWPLRGAIEISGVSASYG